MREKNKLIMARLHKFQLLIRLRQRQLAEDENLHYGQMPLLKYVSDNEGCAQHDVALALGVSEPAVATSVKRLEKAGIITKEAEYNNLRKNKLMLTEGGKEITRTLGERFDALDERVLSVLSDEEAKALCDILDKMSAVIDDEEAPGLSAESIRGLARRVFGKDEKKGDNQ